MQLISETYDILKTLGGLTNTEMAAVFTEWNNAELKSFLVEITAIILAKKDDKAEGFLVDKIVDKTGAKGTGGCGVCMGDCRALGACCVGCAYSKTAIGVGNSRLEVTCFRL